MTKGRPHVTGGISGTKAVRSDTKAVRSERDISLLATRFAALSFLTYLVFLLLVLLLSSRSGTALYLAPDSKTYIAPANNLLNHGQFSRELSSPYLREPYRTPGYPLLIAAFLAITGNPMSVLAAAPLLAAFLAFTLVRLTWELFGDRHAARLAGFAVAFFPNGLGLSVMVLTDFAHGCFFIFALWATFRAIRDHSAVNGAAAALFWMAAQLIRPTLSVAFVLIVAIGVWLARDRWQIAMIAALTLLSFAVPLYLSWRTLEAHGIFVPSLQGEMAMAEIVIPRGEALATGRDIGEMARKAHLQDEQTAAAGSAPGRNIYVRIYNAERARAGPTFQRYRPYVFLGLAMEAVRQVLAPWDWIVVSVFGETVFWARVFCGILYLAFLALAVLGTSIAVRRVGFGTPAVLWFIFLFWIGTSAFNFFAGARYRLPGDLTLIPLAALGAKDAPAIWSRLRPGRQET
jgi:4-amino-4-deoxy-L-arabinose transferase-like glycosyltransferase